MGITGIVGIIQTAVPLLQTLLSAQSTDPDAKRAVDKVANIIITSTNVLSHGVDADADLAARIEEFTADLAQIKENGGLKEEHTDALGERLRIAQESLERAVAANKAAAG